jgi:hypothetical protein
VQVVTVEQAFFILKIIKQETKIARTLQVLLSGYMHVADKCYMETYMTVRVRLGFRSSGDNFVHTE